MPRATDKYADYVEHPRYGRRPRITGLNPQGGFWGAAYYRTSFSWHSPPGCRIPNTAVAADLDKQQPRPVPVTHYFDVERKCRDCKRPFIFFADEQKHWYEELGFGLDSDCVRCTECRKMQQGIARQRESYEDLFHVADRTPEQDLEMAECCLKLIEAGVFGRRQTERIRMLFNRAKTKERDERRWQSLLARVQAIETLVRSDAKN
jgi:hypothetical protein